MGASAPPQTPPEPRGALARAVQGIDPQVWDVALAFSLCVAGFVFVLAAPTGPFHRFNAVGAVLLLAMTLPLIAVRRYPRAVFAIVAFASILGAITQQPSLDVGYVCGAVALFILAARSDIWRSLWAGLLASATLIVIFAVLYERGVASIAVSIAAWFGFSAVWLAGVILHGYRESVREARESAHVERERAELYLHDLEMRAEEAVALERGRLARELHDVVGHALNVVVLQAGAAQRVFDKRPDTVREALGAIEVTGRQALTDIERLLGILRAESGDREDLGALPGMADVPALVAQVREAGVAVELDSACRDVTLSSSLDRSCYRIVQEALTNTLKHAGRGARATVRLRCADGWFDIECADDGGGRPAAGQFNRRLSGGRGLLGMRERVALFGGELEVGPLPTSGFRVRARLPLEGAANVQGDGGPADGPARTGGGDG